MVEYGRENIKIFSKYCVWTWTGFEPMWPRYTVCLCGHDYIRLTDASTDSEQRTGRWGLRMSHSEGASGTDQTTWAGTSQSCQLHYSATRDGSDLHCHQTMSLSHFPKYLYFYWTMQAESWRTQTRHIKEGCTLVKTMTTSICTHLVSHYCLTT